MVPSPVSGRGRPVRLRQALLLAAALAGAAPALAQAPPAPTPAPRGPAQPVPTPAPPQAAPGPAVSKVMLDSMLSALKVAPNEEAAGMLEERIKQAWLNAGTPAVTLLLGRGMREMAAGANQDALDDFDAALDLDASLPEAWNRRALARLHAGDLRGAIRDIEEVLKREPRHFAALQELSRVAESQENWKGAYTAWQKVLEIDPQTPGGQERLRDLQRRAEGEGI